MVETLRHLIEQYGYFAVVLGCILEGEMAVLLGVFAAQEELLILAGVIPAALAGTIIGDNFWFHAGRRLGRPALEKRADWRAKAGRIESLMERYGAPVMVGFRFFYGLRSVTPFVLGSLNISPWRFLALEALGAVLWVVTISLIGVFLADAVDSALARIQNVEKALLVVLLLAAMASFVIYSLNKWKKIR